MTERPPIGPAEREPRDEATSLLPIARVAAVARAGLRDPVVVILALAGFFDAISGNPIHGLVLGAAAAAIASDESVGLADGPRWPGLPPDPARPATERTRRFSPAIEARVAGSMGWYLKVVIASAALSYAVVVGSFDRYSWPATLAILAVGSVAVVIAWRGHLDPNASLPDGGGAVAWAVALIAIGLWELAALLMQPTLTTDSWAHPTLSTLMDPVLGTHPGRTISILVWLTFGGFLIRP